MSEETSDYKRAYESAQKEFKALLDAARQTEKRLLVVRKSIQTLRELCESEGVEVEPSEEAADMLENSTLAEEIRTILKARHPARLRPNEVKNELVKLGHDLSAYQNPQATIHMVLKRMVESGEVVETISPEDGKKSYQWIRRFPRVRSAKAKAFLGIKR
jgi:hypothetical protein